jgi:hypothetical protein
MSLISVLAFFAYMTSVSPAVGRAAAEPVWAQEAGAQQSSVDFYDVQEIPLTVSDATMGYEEGGLVLKGSAANRSPERIMGARFIILVVARSGKLRSRAGWTERMALEGYSAKEFSLRLPVKLKAAPGDRTILAVEQVIGRESIWKVVNAKEAFASYATNSDFVAPDVRRVSNQGDFLPGIGVLPE